MKIAIVIPPLILGLPREKIREYLRLLLYPGNSVLNELEILVHNSMCTLLIIMMHVCIMKKCAPYQILFQKPCTTL